MKVIPLNDLDKFIISVPEKETRVIFLSHAEYLGCKTEFEEILTRIDEDMKNCEDENERKAIATSGIMEVDKLFTFHQREMWKFYPGMI